MSIKLAPSKSTIYVSNLPFSLTNNDMHKIFEKYGAVGKVTILRDDRHRSKGVAFIMYVEKDSAHQAVKALNNTKMFDRTIRCSIAKDNGRTTEFIKKKIYKDKSKCYECGDEGHLSYNCPKNLLGDRELPEKKKKKRKWDDDDDAEHDEEQNSDNEESSGVDSLAAAIQYEQQKSSELLGSCSYYATACEPKKKKYKKDTYFSDEEELDDD
ncbi:zinc finger CCHC-type and RNA-binding motif-containing protein 1-like [Gigantopelta aegis]|uniref:zinc finger CCHC-type and RNA-binding motif-containing protein 1-like n=1 Tax=Gigantopelta aegis TaxID=1735272 RepID=UPI001B888925|nr:zinc finger CCHC-type and RNA-binding motif-containing protein 1-like [Gigantopelta aegis]